jgi:SNF2 family DNA or RNA helicase
MAILHGSWLIQPRPSQTHSQPAFDLEESQGGLLLWGETWRRLTTESLPNLAIAPLLPTKSPANPASAAELFPIPRQPYGMERAELLAFLTHLQQAGKIQLIDLADLAPTPEPAPKSRKSRKSPTETTESKPFASPPIASTPIASPSQPTVLWRSQAIAMPSGCVEGNFAAPEAARIAPQYSTNLEPSGQEILLFPWQVEGLLLPAATALDFLNSLPLGTVALEESFVGGDLRYWSHMARWNLDLLARSKFLPSLELVCQANPESQDLKSQHPESQDLQSHDSESQDSASQPIALAEWQPLLDSAIDQERLLQFRDRIPVACRFYQQIYQQKAEGKRQQAEAESGGRVEHSEAHQKAEGRGERGEASAFCVALPTDPTLLLQDFLQQMTEAQILRVVQAQPWEAGNSDSQAGNGTSSNNKPSNNKPSNNKPSNSKLSPSKPGPSKPIAPAINAWLSGLGNPGAAIHSPGLAALEQSLQTWMMPLHYRRAESAFRNALLLHPPEPGSTDWKLEYCLQAVDDSEFLVDAQTIWHNPIERLNYHGRTIIQPQETFLRGLGLVSRLYPPIEPSLQESHPQQCLLSPLQAYEFLKTSAWRLQDSGVGVVVPPNLASQGGWANRLGLKIQAKTGTLKKGQRLGLQSLLNFRWELTIGGQTLSKEEFDRLVSQNAPLVEINGEWVELRPQDIRAAQSFFASRKDQPALSLEDALRISTGDTQMVEKLPVVSFEASGALEELINTLSGKRNLEAIATPETFCGELRPYQSRGVGWLAFLEEWSLGACLADDMGLGKTIQLIAFLLHLQQQDTLDKPVLLICPTSVLGNWEREVKKFGPSLTVIQHHGDHRAKAANFTKAIKGKHLVITSYALVYRDLKDLQSIAWRGIVLDEAQNIKNPDAKQSKAVRDLEGQFRIALTGTPVENRLFELWSILDFLNPGYLGPKNFFQRRFAAPIERYGDAASLQTLKALVQPFILRRLKSDKDIIQDLPDKQEINVFCGLSHEQASLYQHLVEKSMADIEAAEGIQRKGIILALLTKLKQICNHPLLFLKTGNEQESAQKADDQNSSIAASPARLISTAPQGAEMAEEIPNSPIADSFQSRSAKLKRLEEMLEEVMAEGDRALIFTQFAEWGKLLKAHLEKQLGREVLFLYGSTSKKQREEMVDRFQSDPQGPRLFILSLKAGGVGLNLTRANHVFHFDRWWNPAVENQATDRVFRIGQTRNVQVHKFVCSGTIEEKIHDLIESKKALAEQVVGVGENWLTDMNTDQLRDLLLLDRSAIIGDES